LKVIEELELAEPKTKEMVRILTALGVDSSALIITGAPEASVAKSARNLSLVKAMPASILSVIDLLSYKVLLMTESAVRKAEELWGNGLSQGGNSASLRGVAPSGDN
jgi:large subunit ribosomal protein L4